MKKVFSIIAVAVAVSTTSFATTNPGDDAKRSFEQDYPQASIVLYKKVADVSLISFIDYGRYCIALYDERGTKEGEGRYLETGELPILVSQSLQKRLGDYRIIEVLELNTPDEGSCYYASLVSNNTLMVAKMYKNGRVEIVKKEKNRKK